LLEGVKPHNPPRAPIDCIEVLERSESEEKRVKERDEKKERKCVPTRLASSTSQTWTRQANDLRWSLPIKCEPLSECIYILSLMRAWLVCWSWVGRLIETIWWFTAEPHRTSAACRSWR